MTATAADARTVGQLLGFIRDSGQPEYLLFWGHQPLPSGGIGKGCLSQWRPVAFTVDGVTYASAEHLMMAAKALLFSDAEMAERIRAAPHPGAAKTLGRQVRGFDEQRWAQRRFDLVVTGNLAKFGRHPATLHAALRVIQQDLPHSSRFDRGFGCHGTMSLSRVSPAGASRERGTGVFPVSLPPSPGAGGRRGGQTSRALGRHGALCRRHSYWLPVMQGMPDSRLSL